MSDLPRGTSETSETPRRVQDADYDTWLTKDQAAAAIGGSTKMVQRLAAEGQIQQASTQRQGRGAFRTVYQPDDVARIASGRRGAAVAFVLPAGVTAPENGNGHHDVDALTVPPAAALASQDQLASFWCNFVAAIQTVSKTSRTAEARFLTLDEAAAELRLTVPCVRRLIKAAGIATVRDAAGQHIRRRDLEAL